ncbi:hypothetical protein HQ544_04635 [Candidatus Falkowbacteria bacterium]|nr:hypothetical protein [Candidatus Falkowbacteria bacterium]
MSKVLNELKELITDSSIPVEEQNDLLVFLPILPEETMGNLIKVFKEDPDKIKNFNANFKSKVQAITGGEDGEWDKVIEEEEKAVGEIPEDVDEVEEKDDAVADSEYDEENPDVSN